MVVAGHLGDAPAARAGWDDPDPAVRAAALGALTRTGQLDEAVLAEAFADRSPLVRRRACEEVMARGGPPASETLESEGPALVVGRLEDGDPTVVEAACFALGELWAGRPGEGDVVLRLSQVATGHGDPLCREAAVAALGSIGDPGGLAAILVATGDRPAVRRRAVLALAPFDGPDVDAALATALGDRDWQVRQAAEDLTAT